MIPSLCRVWIQVLRPLDEIVRVPPGVGLVVADAKIIVAPERANQRIGQSPVRAAGDAGMPGARFVAEHGGEAMDAEQQHRLRGAGVEQSGHGAMVGVEQGLAAAPGVGGCQPGVAGDGIVPNITMNYGGDDWEGQFYFGYYLPLRDEAPEVRRDPASSAITWMSSPIARSPPSKTRVVPVTPSVRVTSGPFTRPT